MEQEVQKRLNDKAWLTHIIETELVRQLKFNSSSRHSYINCTMNQIYNKIDEAIHEEVIKRLKVELIHPSEGTSGNENLDESIFSIL